MALRRSGARCAGAVLLRRDQRRREHIHSRPHRIAHRQSQFGRHAPKILGAVGVSGAPKAELDEACAKAGLDKVLDQLR